ncbi:hypothetical protein LPJ77_003835 [Coemansia sp. RSA 2523]|nr:hypothetical protein LPJ58_004885 [Coemansia sp. RSA 1591]KAJ1756261.1 hypothetical protein LPJ69_004840 [Coemansia sp. RSA 1752]KAJ1775790.1 hypothetical protein LPJ54_003488 [Coemansia sp. RSA 1824]KAJ1783358.1 hypothetical protein LPJ67_004751 [Coemansia sp. RSA 1938]KAJ1806087.1 hypothetical protein LPJ77_003835 [Coemansia sp. RSA 2523]KAJ2133994.1 hypothetical protein GGH17_003004 [Coemansia sp. RSA 788]KAJ2139387.1 hypothetical protein J3F82_005798 [Coemansia sp. RSA 637]KAJ2147117.
MSSLESLQVLNTLTKRKTSKRVRKERSKQMLDTLVRKPQEPTKVAKKQRPKAQKAKMTETEMRRSRNAATMRAADRMVSKKSQDLHKEVLEMMRAQKEQRRPRIKQKHKLTYLDFEDKDA